MRYFWLYMVIFSGALFCEASPQELTEDQYLKFQEAAKDLRCPTCTGLSVLESDAPFSKQIKDLVEEKVKEGASHKEIMTYFTERYGPWILREPPKYGVNLIAWLFPLILLVGGPICVWFFVWRKRKNVETFGVRSADKILVDFYKAVEAAKGAKS